jgi:hypothetical protein
VLDTEAAAIMCQRMLDDGIELPEQGGERPHLVITMSWEQLRDQVGHGLIDTGDLLIPETVRRLACDARIIPTVLGGHGQVLDVGRDGGATASSGVREGREGFCQEERNGLLCVVHPAVASCGKQQTTEEDITGQ